MDARCNKTTRQKRMCMKYMKQNLSEGIAAWREVGIHGKKKEKKAEMWF
jgi:hypothetical protein